MKIQIEVSRPRWLQLPRTRRGRGFAAMALAALVVAVPVAWAGHDFADVPNGALFHDEIAAIKRAGITTGCGGPNYCPTEFVRRDAMAAFMHRGYGRVGQATGSASAALTDLYTEVVEIQITPGAVAASPTPNGFIQASGFLQFRSTNALGCPCIIEAFARVGGVPLTPRTSIATMPSIASDTWVTLPIAGAIAATPGIKTIEVVARKASGTATVVVQGSELLANYVPFGRHGTNVLSEPATETPSTGLGSTAGASN